MLFLIPIFNCFPKLLIFQEEILLSLWKGEVVLALYVYPNPNHQGPSLLGRPAILGFQV